MNFFKLSLLYSLCHTQSLDSHRVRCMNSRTIIREISQEVMLQLGSKEELSGIYKEAGSILREDFIIGHEYSKYLNILLPLLDNPPKRKDISRFNTMHFIINDLHSQLEHEYFSKLCLSLPIIIGTGNEDEIKSVLSSLLTDLIDRNWPLESLFSWHRTFIQQPPKYSFNDNLILMLQILESSSQEYEVCFKLSRCSQLHLLGKQGDFTFSNLPPAIINQSPESQKFSKIYPSDCFVTTILLSYDHRSAAINALNKLEQLIDLVRLGFEPDKIINDDVCYTKRSADAKEVMITLKHALPNPIETMQQRDFITFNNKLDGILNRSFFESRSKEQIQASIRQYRFGRDIDNYKDKFIYFWMGLEYLSHTNGPIGSVVTHNVSRCLALIYIRQLLQDWLYTMQYLKLPLSTGIKTLTGINDIRNLTLDNLLLILNSPNDISELLNTSTDNPSVKYYGTKLAHNLSNFSSTNTLLTQHLNHLEWHLDRLYRIRCCIVHGSEVKFPLRLFTANLEYYLRQMIQICIGYFYKNEHVTSLDELFLRANIAYDRYVTLLNNNASYQEAIKNLVFSDTIAIPYN